MDLITRCRDCKYVKKSESGEWFCKPLDRECFKVKPGDCKGPFIVDDLMERTLDDLINLEVFDSTAVASLSGSVDLPVVKITSLPVRLNYEKTNEDLGRLTGAFNINAQILRNVLDRLERLENKEHAEFIHLKISKKKLADLNYELNKKLDAPDENWRCWATGAFWMMESLGLYEERYMEDKDDQD